MNTYAFPVLEVREEAPVEGVTTTVVGIICDDLSYPPDLGAVAG